MGSNPIRHPMPYKDVRRQQVCTYQSAKRRRDEARIKCIELLGGRCVNCGFSDVRALCIDHVNGGGNQEQLQFGGATIAYYRHVLSKISGGSADYQVLCCNHNTIKRCERNE